MRSSINVNLQTDKLIIKLNEKCEQKELMQAIKKKLPQLKTLYQDDKTPILVTGKVLKNKEMDEIEKLLKDTLKVKVEFESSKILGLHGIKKTFKREIEASETIFHRGALRSGNKLEFEGSIVVLGDVNAGAEVIAGENIVVVGILRGLAHAGAKGNKNAIISAASIEAPQLRIANIVKEVEKDEILDGIKTYAYLNEQDEMIIE